MRGNEQGTSQGARRDDNRDRPPGWQGSNDRRTADDRRGDNERWRSGVRPTDNDRRPDNDRRWGNDRRWDNDRRADNNRRPDDNRWRNGNGQNRSWDRNSWRRDNRYDWQSHRTRNRSAYRIGRYYAPYQNYSYRRIGIGFSLGSMFYGKRYWINDPWQYRLPDVYGPYRWVRYYDDVLLIDTYSGEVMDVIYDFFW